MGLCEDRNDYHRSFKAVSNDDVIRRDSHNFKIFSRYLLHAFGRKFVEYFFIQELAREGMMIAVMLTFSLPVGGTGVPISVV